MVTSMIYFERVIFVRSVIEAILTADGRSNSKIHSNSNSKPISSLLSTRKRWVQSDVRVHAGVKCPQPIAHWCHCRSPTEGTAHICRYTDIDPRIQWRQSADSSVPLEMLTLSLICTVVRCLTSSLEYSRVSVWVLECMSKCTRSTRGRVHVSARNWLAGRCYTTCVTRTCLSSYLLVVL